MKIVNIWNGMQMVKLYIKCDRTNNKLNSEYLEWYESGQTFTKYNYVNGEKKYDKSLEWHESGQLKTKT